MFRGHVFADLARCHVGVLLKVLADGLPIARAGSASGCFYLRLDPLMVCCTLM